MRCRALLLAPLLALTLVGLDAAAASAAPSNPECNKWVGTAPLVSGGVPAPDVYVGYSEFFGTGSPLYAFGYAGACYAYSGGALAPWDYGVGGGFGAGQAPYAGWIATGSASYASPADQHSINAGAALLGYCGSGFAKVGAVYTDVTSPPTYRCL